MNKKSFSILCFLSLTLAFSVSATAALIPSIAATFGCSALWAGKLVWAYMLPYGLCALLWAPLTRKFKVKHIIICALFIFSLAALMVSFAPALPVALWGRLLMGVFGSAFTPLALIIIGKEAKARRKSRLVGLFFSFSFASGLSGIFLSGFLPWRLIYFIPFLSGVVTALLALSWLPDYNYRSAFRISYRETVKDKEVLSLFAFIFAASFLYHSIQQWLGVYLAQDYSFSQMMISIVFTISSAVAICSESLGGILSGRGSGLRVAYYGLCFMAAFVFLLGMVSSPAMIFFIVVLWGMGWAFNHVGMSSFITALPDKFLRDASSLNSSVRFIAGGLGAFLGGKAILWGGFTVHFLAVGVLIVFLAFQLRKTKG